MTKCRRKTCFLASGSFFAASMAKHSAFICRFLTYRVFRAIGGTRVQIKHSVVLGVALPIVLIIAFFYLLFFYVLFDDAAFQLAYASGSFKGSIEGTLFVVILLSLMMAAIVFALEMTLLVRYRRSFFILNLVHAPVFLFVVYYVLASDNYIPFLRE